MSLQSASAAELGKRIYKLVHRSPALTNSDEFAAKYHRYKKMNKKMPVSAFELLGNLIIQNDWDEQISEASVQNKWIEIVGNYMAENSSLVEISNRKAKIKVNESAWATQIKLLKNDIIKRINEIAKRELVNDIVITNTEKPLGGKYFRPRNIKPRW